jgi:hypothetical protein
MCPAWFLILLWVLIPNFCGSNWLSYRRWGHNARSIYPVASHLSF